MSRNNDAPGCSKALEPVPVPPRKPDRVLVCASSPRKIDQIAQALPACRAVRVANLDQLRQALRDSADAAFVWCEPGDSLVLVEEAAARVATVVVSEHPTLDHATQMMRVGAVDLIPLPARSKDAPDRLREALVRAGKSRKLEARVERLRLVCRRLNDARRQVSSQVGSLCNDLVEAYQELSDKVTHMNVATEFSSLIRQELDVESLLRTALEFVLAKTGPTNAAVYLPATSGDYSLGAYVNYDGPKDAADMLLEQMAGVVAPRMEREKGVLYLRTGQDVTDFLGADSHWLGEAGAVAFPCRHDGECLAVVILFRDKRTPISEDLRPVFQTIADLFGRQLARVIHIHHRHLPKEKWGGFAGPEDDDIDLAA